MFKTRYSTKILFTYNPKCERNIIENHFAPHFSLYDDLEYNLYESIFPVNSFLIRQTDADRIRWFTNWNSFGLLRPSYSTWSSLVTMPLCRVITLQQNDSKISVVSFSSLLKADKIFCYVRSPQVFASCKLIIINLNVRVPWMPVCKRTFKHLFIL